MKAIHITTAKKNTVDLPIGNRVYPVALSLHILDMIQNEFGSLQEAIDKSNNVTVMARLLYLLIDDAVFVHNEETDEETDKWKPLSEEYISRKISVQDLVDLNPLLVKCFIGSLPDSEPINGEEIPDEALEVLSDIPVTEKN